MCLVKVKMGGKLVKTLFDGGKGPLVSKVFAKIVFAPEARYPRQNSDGRIGSKGYIA